MFSQDGRSVYWKDTINQCFKFDGKPNSEDIASDYNKRKEFLITIISAFKEDVQLQSITPQLSYEQWLNLLSVTTDEELSVLTRVILPSQELESNFAQGIENVEQEPNILRFIDVFNLKGIELNPKIIINAISNLLSAKYPDHLYTQPVSIPFKLLLSILKLYLHHSNRSSDIENLERINIPTIFSAAQQHHEEHEIVSYLFLIGIMGNGKEFIYFNNLNSPNAQAGRGMIWNMLEKGNVTIAQKCFEIIKYSDTLIGQILDLTGLEECIFLTQLNTLLLEGGFGERIIQEIRSFDNFKVVLPFIEESKKGIFSELVLRSEAFKESFSNLSTEEVLLNFKSIEPLLIFEDKDIVIDKVKGALLDVSTEQWKEELFLDDSPSMNFLNLVREKDSSFKLTLYYFDALNDHSERICQGTLTAVSFKKWVIAVNALEEGTWRPKYESEICTKLERHNLKVSDQFLEFNQDFFNKDELRQVFAKHQRILESMLDEALKAKDEIMLGYLIKLLILGDSSYKSNSTYLSSLEERLLSMTEQGQLSDSIAMLIEQIRSLFGINEPAKD